MKLSWQNVSFCLLLVKSHRDTSPSCSISPNHTSLASSSQFSFSSPLPEQGLNVTRVFIPYQQPFPNPKVFTDHPRTGRIPGNSGDMLSFGANLGLS